MRSLLASSAAVAALSIGCVSVPEVRPDIPGGVTTLQPAAMDDSREFARRVFEVLTARPVPSPCRDIDEDLGRLAGNQGWSEYTREPPISAGPWEQKRYRLHYGVDMVIDKKFYDEDSFRYPTLQVHVSDTDAGHENAGLFLGVMCDDQ
ncbi:MAG: hypothetical protein AAB592_03575 [Patescibacteria group bacterium]